ncbi:MAG: hypothetical protein L3K26_00210 [Candidatus Hydrogenedentes bacterium]|nr:hypothetical protein [Candidatus Hydrogenedentota bacterium]
MSFLRRLKRIAKTKLVDGHYLLEFTHHQRRMAFEDLRAGERYRQTKALIPHGHRVFSQSDEDGIITEIFRRIGTTNKTFVEFGAGSGLESNTASLLMQGWTGLWLEGSPQLAKEIRQGLKPLIDEGRLKLERAILTRENIDGLVARNMEGPEIDLLSVDVDGNDFHLYEAIQCVKARVLVFEYNAKFPPPISWCFKYDPSHVWNVTDDCFGVSLQYLEDHLKEDYALVGCNLTGVNAFFVRRDLVEDKFLEPYTAVTHYEPARLELIRIPSGFASCYQTILNGAEDAS